MQPLNERIASRDRGALEELISRESSRVQVIIHRFIEGFGDIEDVEELTSDVFFQGLARY